MVTREEAAKMLTAKVECMERENSGTDLDCNHRNCDECDLCYSQGTMGEQLESLKMAIEALSREPSEDVISRQWLMECANEGWIKFDTEKDENIFIHLVRDIAPSAQSKAMSAILDVQKITKHKSDFSDLPSAQPESFSCGQENDTISRRAAIGALKDLEFCHYMEFGEYVGEDTREVRLIRAEKAQDALQSLPSAQPEQRWISVSERLPEENDYNSCIECLDGAVWYFTENGTMGLGYYYKSTKEWSTTDDLKTDEKVVAWMSLPKAYKGGNDA